jgi:WD40 repeat protein
VRDKPAKVNGLSFNNTEEYLVIAYNTNEICYMNIEGININLKNRLFEIRFELVCDGFHQGPITSMDVALQRPIIITSSQADKTIRVWNYLTGHCEYCKIILTEKDDVEKEMDILAVAIHPNGYYIAVSDREMIRFFHLCYKELRFYNNDVVGIENPKANCHLLKFSHGGHLLAAVSGKTLIIMRAYTRETLKTFRTNHSGQIKNIVFDDTDYYVYTTGNDGMIIEYNLFDFRM